MEIHSMIKNAIVLVPFPFDDFSNAKVRPALCLTNEITKFNHVIIAFISSKIPEETIDSDILIKKKFRRLGRNWIDSRLGDKIT